MLYLDGKHEVWCQLGLCIDCPGQGMGIGVIVKGHKVLGYRRKVLKLYCVDEHTTL